METINQTVITDFLLVGFSQDLQTCILLFLLFFVIYLLTLLGNSFLIFTVSVSPKLHTPMYYFLCNLSFLDLCISSSTVPKMLVDTFSKKRRISIIGCLVQMTVTIFLAATECILLAVMAYDRYVAICSPLYYTAIISWRFCTYISVILYLGNFILTTAPLLLKPFVFCKETTLNHFLCEVLVVLEVACGDLFIYRTILVVGGIFMLLLSPSFIMVSYICIVISVLKIRSVGGRSKAFSTCASHLTVVVMFYGTMMTMYMGQAAGFSSYLKYISIIYAILIPVFNPLIYSLRNNEVRENFQKVFSKTYATVIKT